MFWVKRVGETVAVGWGEAGEGLFDRGYNKADDDVDDETGERKAVTGGEVSGRGSISSSPNDPLPLWKEGEQGGVTSWIPSPREQDRLLLAMELAVGFM